MDRYVHLVQVHGHNRDRRIGGFRQHVSPSREPHRGTAVADIGLDLRGTRQLLAFIRRQTLADGQFIAFAALDPVDAQLLALCLDWQRRAAGDFDIGRIVDARLGQGLGELDANPGLGTVRIDIMPDHTKAVVRDRVGQLFLGLLAWRHGLRQA